MTSELEAIISYEFQDKGLLKNALTHSSYANEHKREHIPDNERLEFLGDAVLETVSSEELYFRYPEKPEGELSKLRASMVCEPVLAKFARDMRLNEFVYLGKGEDNLGGRTRDSILSDTLEALIGAIYLDGGFERARDFVSSNILKKIEEKDLFVDCKTKLQETVQDMKKTVTYEITGESGPDHDKTFEVEVFIDGTPMGKGTGHTKKAAQQMAANAALERLAGED